LKFKAKQRPGITCRCGAKLLSSSSGNCFVCDDSQRPKPLTRKV
jgi:hypothetical protein